MDSAPDVTFGLGAAYLGAAVILEGGTTRVGSRGRLTWARFAFDGCRHARRSPGRGQAETSRTEGRVRLSPAPQQ